MAAGARELEERLDGRRHPNDLRLGRPAPPHRDDDDAPRPRRAARATWPVTAVLPTRFPVPMTASDGRPNGANDGGSKRKSAPSYGHAEREHAARERATARRGPSTGSSERSSTSSGA